MGRFAGNDLIRILTHQAGREQGEPSRAGEGHSLQPGTSAWSNFGLATTAPGDDGDDAGDAMTAVEGGEL